MSQNEYPEDDLNPQDLTEVLPTFQRLSPGGRARLLQTIATFFGIERRLTNLLEPSAIPRPSPVGTESNGFSQDRSLSAKEFMIQKDPQTDIERIACLAYYLTHYRDLPHFKTIDLSKLNTEAAQPKFSNAAVAVDNATKRGYLVSATKGNKQLSATGEQYVHALPDRESAKAIIAKARPRKRRKSKLKESDENASRRKD